MEKLKSNRLILVPVSQRHTFDVFDNFNKDIILYMAPSVASHINETKEVIQNFIDQRKNDTDHVYAITLKDSNEFIGLVGLHNRKSEIPEIGIWTKLSAHGNHYGREAVGAIIKHAKEMNIMKVSYPVDQRNIASRKIPLFFGAKLITALKKVETSDGRILEEEIYEIST